MRILDTVRSEFPDATHHCWGFVIGPPGSTRQIGMSDDGEPHGTAGRPILHTLLHSGVGEILAVVSRYYGGTKLGKGGLGRAYAGGVQEALMALPTTMRVARIRVGLTVAYPTLEGVRRVLEGLEGEVLEEVFGAGVVMEVQLPEVHLGALVAQVGDATGGRGEVLLMEDADQTAEAEGPNGG